MRVRLLHASETDRSSVRCIVVDDQSVASKFRRLLLSPFSSVSIYPSFFIKIAWVVSISLYEALNEVKAILVTEIEAV